VPTRTARVSGVVVNADGKPASGGLIMVIQRSSNVFFANAGGQIRPDGTFSIGGLAPGEYTLRAQIGAPRPDGPGETGVATVSVSGADIDNVRVAPPRLGTISGRVIVDPAIADALKPQLIRLFAAPRTPGDAMIGMQPPPQPLKPDATFELKAYPGTFTLNMVQTPDWMVKSVRLNGSDVTDSGFEVRTDEDVADLQVELTNRLPELSGAVTDDRGRPVIEYTAIVFPQERGAPGAVVRSSVARPDQDGRFKFRPLRAGDYYMAAVPYVEQNRWLDPEFVDALRSSATKVTIGDGETKSVDLKILKSP
jgi:hypothetical protein